MLFWMAESNQNPVVSLSRSVDGRHETMINMKSSLIFKVSSYWPP